MSGIKVILKSGEVLNLEKCNLYGENKKLKGFIDFKAVQEQENGYFLVLACVPKKEIEAILTNVTDEELDRFLAVASNQDDEVV